MERFGYSTGFIARIEVWYSNIESVLKVNGSLCASFRVHRDGMLYALILELLLHKLRSTVRDLLLQKLWFYLLMLTILSFLIRAQQNIAAMNDVTSRFSSISAAKVNWVKSEALAVGEWHGGLPVPLVRLVWKSAGLKYLRILLGSENLMAKNWQDTSYRWRLLVLNNLVASLLWHHLTCVEPPFGLLAQIQAKMANCFWDGLHWVLLWPASLPPSECILFKDFSQDLLIKRRGRWQHSGTG